MHRAVVNDLPSEAVIFGNSEGMRTLRARVEATHASHSPLLVQGESGIGKELVARYVHHRSDRGHGPFIRLGCSGIVPEVLERELFGYEDNAFANVSGVRSGVVEAAEGGTLFLSGIEDLGLRLQGKLFQLLREGSYCRVCSPLEQRADVRVICSTRVDLITEVNRGRFRKDLFSCISALCLHPVALRDRKEDIPVLWDFFS